MIEQLKEFVEKNDMINKTIVDFWTAFECWKTEYPEEYAKDFVNIPENEIDIIIETIGLRSSWPDCNYSHATVKASVGYNDRTLGYYTRWFPLGDDITGDDFLEIW